MSRRVLVPLVALLTVLAACGKSDGGLEALNGTPMPYSVVITGGWPNTQALGAPVDLVLRAQNIGQAVPHFVLVLNGLVPTWTVKKVDGCGSPVVPLKRFQNEPAWDLGPLQKKQECDVTFHVVAQSAGTGQSTVVVRSFGGTVGNRAAGHVPVNGGVELIAQVNP